MRSLSPDADLNGIDCHVHSRFSPDAKFCGADDPQGICDAVRRAGLKGFIVTDHIDIGHWNGYIIDFDEYFDAWNKAREENKDLRIYIGIEAGFEPHTALRTAEIIDRYPFEYVINSVHYWLKESGAGDWKYGRKSAYTEYLKAVLASLAAPYPFTAIGHIGFPERYAPYPVGEREMEYSMFRELCDEIIETAVKLGIRPEENTNAEAEMRLPRVDFLRAYKAAGGKRPMLGSDAHNSADIGRRFFETEKILNDIFGEAE